MYLSTLSATGRACRTLACLALCFALGASMSFGQPKASEPRIPALDSSDSPLNIVKTLANHPKLSAAWTPFAGYILGENSLPPRDREILILRTAYVRGTAYEWGHHARMARSVGVTDEEILRVAKGPNANGWSSFDRALLRAVDELLRDASLSDRPWAYLDARYETEQLMDLVFTVGQYNLVSMALKSFRVELDEGLEGFPE